MPKIVDHAARRDQIADALLRVVARDGLTGVSLRLVASEAGVTAGMVQHYFTSKDEMVTFAMQAASARYEQRIRSAVEALGPDASPAATLRAVLLNYLALTPDELHDGRVSLEFQAYAAGREDLAQSLADGDAQLLGWLTTLVSEATGIRSSDAAIRARGLLATAEGLGTHTTTSSIAPTDAIQALDEQLRLNGIR